MPKEATNFAAEGRDRRLKAKGAGQYLGARGLRNGFTCLVIFHVKSLLLVLLL